MKALKSDLAQQILANPSASSQLRVYLARKSAQTFAGTGGEPVEIELPSPQGRPRRYVPVVVPKAA